MESYHIILRVVDINHTIVLNSALKSGTTHKCYDISMLGCGICDEAIIPQESKLYESYV